MNDWMAKRDTLAKAEAERRAARDSKDAARITAANATFKTAQDIELKREKGQPCLHSGSSAANCGWRRT